MRPHNQQDEMILQPVSDQTIQIINNEGKSSTLSFDRVFPDAATQREIFESSGTRELIDLALNGYAATVFAFGQTGSGKTFTITGPPDEPTPDTVGLVPRALDYIFNSPHEQQMTRIQASYLEIYNEHVLDLLNPQNQSLPMRWTPECGFFVEGLLIVDCQTLDDALAVLEEGLRNRTTAAHDKNEHSSRSHSVLSIYFETKQNVDNQEFKKYGNIRFVDLAGSERVKDSKAAGETFHEALNINKSLLTLGKCISVLGDKKKGQHVPYRDSKLTKLLAQSLTGHGQALMIACVSPMLSNVTETAKTLRYASRAKNIQNKPILQIDPKEGIVYDLKKEIEDLKRENLQLKQVLEHHPDYASLLTNIFPDPRLSLADDSPRQSITKDFIASLPTGDEQVSQEQKLESHRKRRSISIPDDQIRLPKISNVSVQDRLPKIQSVPVQDRPPWVHLQSKPKPQINQRRTSGGAKSASRKRIDSLVQSEFPMGQEYKRALTPYPNNSWMPKPSVPSKKNNRQKPFENRVQSNRLTPNVNHVVSNRHLILDDVDALDQEISKLSV
ncbi:P-loop containing nucleoside triphosphate hydrolase protein [Gorgonomyces haynaldii]|nr:P-loop containing nucleoside triphosphate hydrolase protein [Gorgonomyces haynaldii]